MENPGLAMRNRAASRMSCFTRPIIIDAPALARRADNHVPTRCAGATAPHHGLSAVRLLAPVEREMSVGQKPGRIENATFEVPAGFDTDFASVPTPFTWLVPRYGLYTKAAILLSGALAGLAGAAADSAPSSPIALSGLVGTSRTLTVPPAASIFVRAEAVNASATMNSGTLRSPLPRIFTGAEPRRLPIEGALLARKIAPGSLRAFAFERWRDFDEDGWESLRRAAATAPSIRAGQSFDIPASHTSFTRAFPVLSKYSSRMSWRVPGASDTSASRAPYDCFRQLSISTLPSIHSRQPSFPSTPSRRTPPDGIVIAPVHRTVETQQEQLAVEERRRWRHVRHEWRPLELVP